MGGRQGQKQGAELEGDDRCPMRDSGDWDQGGSCGDSESANV